MTLCFSTEVRAFTEWMLCQELIIKGIKGMDVFKGFLEATEFFLCMAKSWRNTEFVKGKKYFSYLFSPKTSFELM